VLLLLSRQTTVSTVTWAGRQWIKRDSNAVTEAPGPNRWSSALATVDGAGALTLQIAQIGGVWYSSELIGNFSSLGYGSYKFTFESDVAAYGSVPVLGFFTYEDNSVVSGNREIDIEYTSFGNTNERSKAQYTVQPTSAEQTGKHVMPNGKGPFVCEFIWQAGQVYYKTTDSLGTVLGEHTIVDNVPTPGSEKIHLNFWLNGGSTPTDAVLSSATRQSVTSTSTYAGTQVVTAARQSATGTSTYAGTQSFSAKITDFTFTPNTTYTIPAASTYQLNFDDARRLDFVSLTGSVTSSNLVIPATSSYATIRTGNVMDLRSSSMIIDVAERTAVGSGTTESIWRITSDALNYLQMSVTNTSMLLRHRLAGVDSDVYIADPTARFWRISESSGTVTWSTSNDRYTWTTQRTATPAYGILLGRVRAEWLAGYYGTEASPGTFQVSTLNGRFGWFAVINNAEVATLFRSIP
jgi:hypothetical protein